MGGGIGRAAVLGGAVLRGTTVIYLFFQRVGIPILVSQPLWAAVLV